MYTAESMLKIALKGLKKSERKYLKRYPNDMQLNADITIAISRIEQCLNVYFNSENKKGNNRKCCRISYS